MSPRQQPTRLKPQKLKDQKNGENNCCKTIGSPIRRPAKQRQTLIGLGLNKMHKTRELEDTPAVRGMVNKIPHMVEIIEERDN